MENVVEPEVSFGAQCVRDGFKRASRMSSRQASPLGSYDVCN